MKAALRPTITFIKEPINKNHMKRLLIIPVLIILYIFFIDFITQNSLIGGATQALGGGGAGEVVGLGQAVTVSVQRPYLFGLFYLPTYSNDFGYIGGWHDAFFAFVIVLTISLLLLEFKNRKEIKGKKTKSQGR